MNEAALAQVKQLAAHLSREERSHLAAWLEGTLDEPRTTSGTRASRSLYGTCAGLGLGSMDDDIDDMRREMWTTFPREDIA